MAGLEVEGLFTAALGLTEPWKVDKVELNTAKRRIDFEVIDTGGRRACPACGAQSQPVHEWVRRSWRHLDLFQFEAWLHASIPRVGCTACGKTSQLPVPSAREGSGFNMLFEALAIALCQDLPVRQAAQMLRVADKQLWRRIEHYVEQACARQDMSQVPIVGVDETSVCCGQQYITVVHDLDAKRLLFATPGRAHSTVARFAKDLVAHQGRTEQIERVCMDMSAAYALGVATSLPQAQISYDRFHVVALANEAMDEVRNVEWKQEAARVKDKLGPLNTRERRSVCGPCGATPRAGAPRRPRPYTGCSAPTSRARGSGD